MRLESTIIERVETFIRHPTFAKSDAVMETVLEDLGSRAETLPAGPAILQAEIPTAQRVAEVIGGTCR